MQTAPSTPTRLDYLDATRAFALVLGVIFHASLSFLPIFIGWAVQDVSTSPLVGWFITVSHTFRMATFFLLAGFFGHMTCERRGVADFVRTRLVRLGVPFVVGWFLLKPLLISGWIMGGASMRGDYDFGSALGEGFASLRALPEGLFFADAPVVSALPAAPHRVRSDPACDRRSLGRASRPWPALAESFPMGRAGCGGRDGDGVDAHE